MSLRSIPDWTSCSMTAVMARAFASAASLTVAARLMTPPLTCARSGAAFTTPSPVTRICASGTFGGSDEAASTKRDGPAVNTLASIKQQTAPMLLRNGCDMAKYLTVDPCDRSFIHARPGLIDLQKIQPEVGQ